MSQKLKILHIFLKVESVHRAAGNLKKKSEEDFFSIFFSELAGTYDEEQEIIGNETFCTFYITDWG